MDRAFTNFLLHHRNYSHHQQSVAIQQNWRPPSHRLESIANTLLDQADQQKSTPGTTPTPDTTTCPPARALDWSSQLLAYYKVFVDDFIGAAQGDTEQLSNVRRVLLHTLDEVFRALDPWVDGPYQKEPASVKKLRLGDAYWSTKN
mmetsp:Transcript_27953/g.42314  ORF Transcript_27953/g.42314 Transcript_27953/m.42314 type:complete len:146 (+) Transcript_27953:770-1207(+)